MTQAELLREVDTRALGARLRRRREAQGLTQTDLAGDGYSTSYVSRIENGSRRPALKALTELAGRLATPVEDFLRDVPTTEYDEIRLGLDYAELALESGEAVDAERQARESLERAESLSVDEFVIRGHFLLGRSCEALGRLDDAIRELERVVERTSGLLAINAAIALSRCHRETGDLSLAIEVGERVHRRLPELGLEGTNEAVQLAVTVAAAYAERGDLSHATRVCTDAIEWAELLGSPAARSAAYWNASMVYADRGQAQEAVPLASRALALLGETMDARNLARLRAELGVLQLRLEEPQVSEALAQLTRARDDLLASSAGANDLACCEVAMADAYLLAGEPERAYEISLAVESLESPDTRLERAEAKVIRGQAAAALGRDAEAQAICQEAKILLDTCDANRHAAQVLLDLADLLEQVGSVPEAHVAQQKAIAAAGLRSRRQRAVAKTLAEA